MKLGSKPYNDKRKIISISCFSLQKPAYNFKRHYEQYVFMELNKRYAQKKTAMNKAMNNTFSKLRIKRF